MTLIYGLKFQKNIENAYNYQIVSIFLVNVVGIKGEFSSGLSIPNSFYQELKNCLINTDSSCERKIQIELFTNYLV